MILKLHQMGFVAASYYVVFNRGGFYEDPTIFLTSTSIQAAPSVDTVDKIYRSFLEAYYYCDCSLLLHFSNNNQKKLK
jgi:hypothetical protein